MSQYTALNTLAAGDLDPTFGEKHDGKVVLKYPLSNYATGGCIAEGPDGKIYVGGSADPEVEQKNKFILSRLLKNGTLDPAFGDKGQVFIPFAPEQDAAFRQIHFLHHNGEEKVLLSGIDKVKGENLLARLHNDGRLDQSFGVGGKLTIKLPTNVASSLGQDAVIPHASHDAQTQGHCTVHTQGKIYVVTHVYSPVWIAWVAILSRLHPDGSFDTSFNKSGYVAVTNQYWGNSTVNDVLVQNGKITVCGTLKSSGMVALLNEDGSFDASFGKDGFAITDLSFEFMALSTLPEGKVIVAGWSHSHTPRRGVLACFANDGQLDPGFNDGEILIQAFEEVNSLMFFGVGVSEGKIIASGRWLPTTGKTGFGVARYLSDGTLDRDFGHGVGWVHITFDVATPIANAMTLQSDGKILVVGNSGAFSTAAVVARFLNATPSVAPAA